MKKEGQETLTYIQLFQEILLQRKEGKRIVARGRTVVGCVVKNMIFNSEVIVTIK